MLSPLFIPKLGANMSEAVITRWLVEEGAGVSEGQAVLEIETDKAVFEIEAEQSGYLLMRVVSPGCRVTALQVVGVISSKPSETRPDDRQVEMMQQTLREEAEVMDPIGNMIGKDLQLPRQGERSSSGVSDPGQREMKASPRARRLAAENAVDLARMTPSGKEGQITEEDVERVIALRVRVAVVGAGKGGRVVADILRANPDTPVVGFFDDNPAVEGREFMGIPVLGKIPDAPRFFEEEVFDRAIISITKSMALRKEVFEGLREKGIGFVNAIHQTAFVNALAKLGVGNIICAFAHVGFSSVIGDDNLLSSFTNIEHHNEVGSHILFGPHVSTSGSVRIGDCCSLGIGVKIENGINVGANCRVASGRTIFANLKANTVLRTHIASRGRESNP